MVDRDRVQVAINNIMNEAQPAAGDDVDDEPPLRDAGRFACELCGTEFPLEAACK